MKFPLFILARLRRCISHICFWTFLIILSGLATPIDLWAYPHPGGMHTQNQLNAPSNQSAYTQMLSYADAALSQAPNPIQNYYVPGYYENPDAHNLNAARLRNDGKNAYATAIAYALNKQTKYADKAKQICLAWARTNTQVSGFDGPLTMVYAGSALVMAAELVFPSMTSTEQTEFRTWVTNVYRVQANSIRTMTHNGVLNNWADWGEFGMVLSCHLLDDSNGFTAAVGRIKNLINVQIAADGSMPQELSRGSNGIWYTYFSLAPLSAACNVVANVTGEDLYLYSNSKLKKALDYLFTNKQSGPSDAPGNLYEAMIPIYRVSTWESWVAPARPIAVLGHHHAWIFPTLMPPVRPLPQINAGGPSVSPYSADAFFTGGNAATPITTTVSTAGVSNPAPLAVYQTHRYGNMTYTLNNLKPGASYTVRLHFSENYWTASGKRKFNVSINGTQVLSNFDIFATAGGGMKANIQERSATANTSGQIVIGFTSVVDSAAVSGIQILNRSNGITINPVADTYVRDGSYASSSFGTSTTLQTKTETTAPSYSRVTYLKFNISTITGNVTGAKLRLYGKASGTASLTPVHAWSVSNDSWSETTTTWNNMPVVGTSQSSLIVSSTSYQWYEWDVTSYLNSEKSAGQTLVTIALKHSSTCNPVNDFNSRESASNKPELILNTSSP